MNLRTQCCLSAVVRFCVRVNRNWPNTGNWRSFQAVASDNFSILFRDYAEKSRMRKHHREDSDGNFRRWKIRREIVLGGQLAKCFETNSPRRLRHPLELWGQMLAMALPRYLPPFLHDPVDCFPPDEALKRLYIADRPMSRESDIGS